MNTPTPSLAAATEQEIADMVADTARLLLGAKKIASALTHSEIQNREAVALNLRTMICQAGVLVDECSRRLGGLPLYDSPDGWTIPFEILDTP
ncbi:hypothetical protein [Niveibacterium terrae]|uniref:hypothetical protein n=1 Tax=Niveibacterium terrae TaxID=3373598 RepID=UPI003A918B9D